MKNNSNQTWIALSIYLILRKEVEAKETTNNQQSKPNGKESYFLEDFEKSSMKFVLYTNGVSYEFGKCCTFCLKVSAIATCYCPSCREFLCPQCDINTHKHVKRHLNKRSYVSKYDANSACQIIANFCRQIACRSKLREKAKETFERVYDPKTRKHFYRHRETHIIQWNKPLSLGSEEIRPFLSQREASLKILNVYRYWKAHCLVISMIKEQYFKMYLLETGRFIY